MSTKYTISFIKHNQEDFDRFLGPSLESLNGNYLIDCLSDELRPASAYNISLARAKTPYIIFTHEDIQFSSNLLESLDKTIDSLENNFGLLGGAGVDQFGTYLYSNSSQIYSIQTSDACFFVVKRSNLLLFNNIVFDDFHLFTEDYCARLYNNLGLNSYTFLLDMNHWGYTSPDQYFIQHNGSTCQKIGFCWGAYPYYKKIFKEMWPDFHTT